MGPIFFLFLNKGSMALIRLGSVFSNVETSVSAINRPEPPCTSARIRLPQVTSPHLAPGPDRIISQPPERSGTTPTLTTMFPATSVLEHNM